MFEITLYVIEAIIVYTTIFKYFKIKKHWIVYALLTLEYTAVAYITDQFYIFNLPFIAITIVFNSIVLTSMERKHNTYEKICIVTIVQLLAGACGSLSVLRTMFVLHVQVDTIVISPDMFYYLTSIISKVLLYFILRKLLSNHLFYNSEINVKYWKGFSILSITILLLSSYIGELIYTNSIHYTDVYLIMISYLIIIFIIFYLFITLKKQSEIEAKKDIEFMQLKLIQEQYIALENQKQRNEEIKHDLEYFLEMIKKRKKSEEIEVVLLNTIKSIEEQDIQIFSENKIVNSLLIKIKEIGSKYNKKIMFDIQINEIELSLSLYNQLISFTEFMCPNSQSDEIILNVSQVNHYCVFEYIYEPLQDMEFEDTSEENIMTHEKINNRDVIRFIIT